MTLQLILIISLIFYSQSFSQSYELSVFGKSCWPKQLSLVEFLDCPCLAIFVLEDNINSTIRSPSFWIYISQDVFSDSPTRYQGHKSGKIIIENIKTRDHTERLLQYFNYDIKIDDNRIKLYGNKDIFAKDIEVPNDFSSASFFIVLTLLSKKSKLLIRNINIRNIILFISL